MLSSGLTITITRLRAQAPLAAIVVFAFVLLAYVQRFDSSEQRLAGALVFGTLNGIALALLQASHGFARQLQLSELAAPLYGRQLARARALVPCAVVTAALGAYWIVSARYANVPISSVVQAICGVNAATLLALPGCARLGIGRVAFLLAACAAGAGTFLASSAPAAFTAGACVIVGWFALRAYGQTIAGVDASFSMIARLNCGRSSGVRDVTQLLS